MKRTDISGGARDEYTRTLLSVIDRLVDYSRKYYACRLKYHQDIDELIEKDFILPGLQLGEFSEYEKTLFIPLRSKGELKACASLSPVHHLTHEKRQDLAEMVQSILESTLKSVVHLDRLKRIERQLNLVESHSNVVRMDKYRSYRDLEASMVDSDFDGNAVSPKEPAFNIPCLIEANDSLDALKMALEVHELSKRYAFVNFYELDEQIKVDPSLIYSLGPITLFIPNLHRLNLKEQTALNVYLKHYRSPNSPQIISGSEYSKSHLIENFDYNSDVLDRLSVAHLRMTLSFTEYRKRGVLEFLFDSLNSSLRTPGPGNN